MTISIVTRSRALGLGLLAAMLAQAPVPAAARQPDASPAMDTSWTYADFADLADHAQLVLRAKIRKQAEVEPERAPGLKPGWARLYVEASPELALAGALPAAEKLRYLVDVKRLANGKAPRLKGETVLLFGRAVPGRPGEIQLVNARSQLRADPSVEARLVPILREFAAADAPPAVTGIRDALWVPGTLAGESETQIFLATESEAPALLSVVRRPGQPPVWSVSWSELVDQGGQAPARETISWYRLACALPPVLPQRAYLSRDPGVRARTAGDYRFVMEALGPCARNAR